MAEKETIHVPARQLQLVRSNSDALARDLFPNETGWSEADKTLFYKTANGDVLPIGDAPIAIIPGGTKYSKIMALVNAGKLPVVKMVQGQGNKYMYPAWIGGSGTLRFSSTVFTNDNNVTGYWWANVPRSDDAQWTYGYTSLTETEVLKLSYPDPIASGISDEDYGKITGGSYKAILMVVGSGTSQTVANLMVMGAEPKFSYFTYTVEEEQVTGKMVVLSVSPTSVGGHHAVTLTNVPFGGGAGAVPSFWKGAGDGSGVTIQDTTSHAIPIASRGDHTGDDITVADGNFVLSRGVYFWNFNIKLQRTGTSNAIQAVEAAFSDNSALIELDRTRVGDPLTYSFSGLLRIVEDNTAVGLTVTAGSSDALTASILRCAIFRINGVTEGEGGGGGGEDNVIEGVQMPDSQSVLTPDGNKIVHIPYAQPSSGSGDGVAGVITGAEKAKLNSLSGWLAGIVLGSDVYPFNPADGLEFAGGDGIGITLDDSDEIPKLKYEALYAAGLEMTNESHKRLRVRLGRGLQFDSNLGIEIKLGKGLQFNESAGVDANALEIEGYEGIENVVETVEKLANHLDTQITTNFDFPNISGVSDFANTSVSTLANGAGMLCQAFTIPINHDIRTISDDAGSHTLLGIFSMQNYTQSKIMLALYEYSYPEGDAEHGSTTYVGDTGPVDVVAGINEYPLRNRNPQITELRSDRVYYATLYVPNSVHGTSNLSLASIPGYGANNFMNAEPRFSCAVENITYDGHELDMNDPTTTLNHYTAEPSEDPEVPYLNYAIGPWSSQYNERPTAPRFYLQIRNGKRTMPEPSNDPFVDLGDPSLKASATYSGLFPNPGFTIGQQSIVFQEVHPSQACTITEWTIYDNNPTDSLSWGGMVYDGGFENKLCDNSDVNLTELGETSSGSGIYGHKYTHKNGGLQLSANTTYRFVASCQGSSSGSTKIVQYDGTTSKKDLRMAESGYNVSQWVTIAQATQVDGTYLKVKTSDNKEYVI